MTTVHGMKAFASAAAIAAMGALGAAPAAFAQTADPDYDAWQADSAERNDMTPQQDARARDSNSDSAQAFSRLLDGNNPDITGAIDRLDAHLAQCEDYSQSAQNMIAETSGGVENADTLFGEYRRCVETGRDRLAMVENAVERAERRSLDTAGDASATDHWSRIAAVKAQYSRVKLDLNREETRLTQLIDRYNAQL